MRREDFPEPEAVAAIASAADLASTPEPITPDRRLVTTIGETTLTAAVLLSAADEQLLTLVRDARHLRWITRQLVAMGVYHVGAEDIWQEAVVSSYGRDIDPENVIAYVKATAQNYLHSLGRRQRTQQRRFGLRAADMDEEHDLPDTENDELSRLEDNERLRAALILLPARTRLAVVLRYVDGLSTAEAATAMDCAEGTIKGLCHRGVTRLREILGDNDPDGR